MNAHCCRLVVKCKYHAIRHVLGQPHKFSDGSLSFSGRSASSLQGTDLKKSLEKDMEPPNKDLRDFKKQMIRSLTFSDLGIISFGNIGSFVINFTLGFTQFGFCVGYFIFVGNTFTAIFPLTNSSITESVSETVSSFTKPNLSVFHIYNNTSIKHDVINNTFETVLKNRTHFEEVSDAPDLRLMVLTPLPIFAGFALMRTMRHMGYVSVGADISILVGCIVTMVYLIVEFSVDSSWKVAEISKLPLTYGMITSAFEGIGIMIPIESSMEGNRHNFPRFLYISIFTLAVVLGTFGTLGSLRYGDDTEQMLNKNLPNGSWAGIAINICLMIGVILTFPLQMYPVIELLELYIFADGRILGTKKSLSDSESNSDPEETTKLLPGTKSVARTISNEVSTWKRNVLRLLLVLIACAIGVGLKDLFAYVSSFVGSIGGAVLVYILPPLMHLKLCWHQLSWPIRLKDILIIFVFGLFGGIFSVVTTVQQMVEKI